MGEENSTAKANFITQNKNNVIPEIVFGSFEFCHIYTYIIDI